MPNVERGKFTCRGKFRENVPDKTFPWKRHWGVRHDGANIHAPRTPENKSRQHRKKCGEGEERADSETTLQFYLIAESAIRANTIAKIATVSTMPSAAR